MKYWLCAIACASAFVAITGTASAHEKTAFVFGSTSFSDGATVPLDFVRCGGKNVSPELHWSGAPAGTKSFALTVFDPDARKGAGWWHWVAYGIPASTHEIAAGAKVPGTEGDTSFGQPGYGGPCPPPGDSPHHYQFTLYALDETPTGTLDGPALLDAIKGHVLAHARFVGMFGR